MSGLASRLLDASGASRAMLRWKKPRGVVFMMHSVREGGFASARGSGAFAPNDKWAISPSQLRLVVATASSHGFEAVSLDDAVERLNRPSNKPFFVLTFDDGYRDNYDVALPICHELGVPMTVYVTTGFISRSDVAWWHALEEMIAANAEIEFELAGQAFNAQCKSPADKRRAFSSAAELWRVASASSRRESLRRLADAGHGPSIAAAQELFLSEEQLVALSQERDASIGAHSMSHASLSSSSTDELGREVQGCAEDLEALTGQRPRHFAFPFGSGADAKAREFDAARAAGFASAVTTRHGVLGHAAPSLHSLPRVPVFPNDSAASLRAKLSGMTTLVKRSLRWLP